MATPRKPSGATRPKPSGPSGAASKASRLPKTSLPIGYAQDLTVSHKKVLLAGPSHSGKTYFAAQFPNTLWFDSDHNLETVKNMGLNSPVINLSTEDFRTGDMGFLQLRKMLHGLIEQEGELHEFCKESKIETLVFDSLTSLSYQLEEELLANHPNKERKQNMSERLSLPDYNLILGRMLGIVEKFTSADLPYNVVATAHVELATNDITEAVEEQPMLTGKALGRKIPGLFGDVFLTGYDTKENKYFAVNIPTRRFQYAGNRGGSKVAKFYNPTYEEIYG